MKLARKILLSGLTVFVFNTNVFAGKEEVLLLREQIAEAERKVKALKDLRVEKLRTLEKKEAARWEAKYKQNTEVQLMQDKTNELEGRYGRLAGEISSVQEDLQRARAATANAKEKWESVESGTRSRLMQIRQVVEKYSEKISADIPVGIAERTALVAGILEMLDGKESKEEKAIELFGEELADRLELSQSQKLESRQSLFSDGKEQNVWRLRLGTIFIGEMSKDGKKTQALLRTGALTGKTFTWRDDLTEDYTKGIQGAIQALAAGKDADLIPLDVLQNRGSGIGFTKQKNSALKEKLKKWFKDGGLVMYPLMAVALFALFLALERFVVYLLRGIRLRRTEKELMPLVEKEDWDGAIAYCEKNQTSVTNAIGTIIKHRHSSRYAAEKSIKESMLKEIPHLEKRLGLVGALGSSAPLLGLLGTVSGMISLFKVITEAGTNDARILAGGISEALVTTQTGLIIAIPILLLHGFLNERLEGIIARIQATTMTALNRVWPEEESSSTEESQE